MPKYEVRLDCGKTHTIEADCVTTDPNQIRFDTRSFTRAATATTNAEYVPPVLVAWFPANRVSNIIKKD